jgi:tRNA(fMet)-specific endonuclease VapC
MHLLDTNAVAALLRGDPGPLDRLRALRKSEVAVPQPVVAEIAFGLARLPASRRKRELVAAWDALTAELPRAEWTDAVSERFGAIKAALQRRGTPIEDMDVAIAAHALALDATLVTANRRHFDRVEALRVEDWAAPAS